MAGEKTNPGRELVRFMKNNTPGGSIWYLRAAWERLALDQVQRLVDPEASAAFRNRAQRHKEHYGNGFFWEPGHAMPTRAPNMSTLWARPHH